MIFKYTIVGAASAALGPIPTDTATFPIFANAETAAASELSSLNGIKVDYVTESSVVKGTTRAYRNGLYILPSQRITTQNATAGDMAAVAAHSANYRSFWTTDLNYIDSYVAPNAGTTDATKQTGVAFDGSANFGVCRVLTDVNTCSAGRTFNKLNDDTPPQRKDQWLQYKTVGKANMLVYTDETQKYQFQFNEDIALAAQYHSSGSVNTTGTVWCSQWSNTLNTDGTTVTTSTVTKGWSKYTKCNFLYLAGDDQTAPALKIKETDNNKFLLQYIEFLDKSHLNLLPSSDLSSGFFQGAYSAATPFINPWMMIGDLSALPVAATWHKYMNPANHGAGSVGRVRYHTQDEGVVKDYTTSFGDISVFWRSQSKKKAEIDAYNALKADFETKKTPFVQALADRDAQLKDAFNFAPRIVIPERPEEPQPPKKYMGETIDLSKYTRSSAPVTWKAQASANDGNVGLITSLDFTAAPAPEPTFANRIGYLYCSDDDTRTAVSPLGVGHVFGRLGQGNDTMPDNSKPVYWGPVSGKAAGLMIGMYPADSGVVGITDAAKKTQFEVKGSAWQDLNNWNLPPGPATPTSGECPASGAEGAKYIALGAATALAIASSLY